VFRQLTLVKIRSNSEFITSIYMDLYGITVQNYYAYFITDPYLHVQLSFTLRYLMRKCTDNNSLLNNSTW